MKPSDRAYFRHHQSGQLGWIEIIDGKQFVRLDRPTDPNNLVPYRSKEWMPERTVPPLSRHGLAEIQFAADVAFCRVMGLHRLGKRVWRSETEDKRIKWMNEGPDPERAPARARLYRSIRIALEELVEGVSP